MLENISINLIYSMLLVFARLGAAISSLPAIGESFVFSRSRLVFALGLSVVLTPILQPQLPKMPTDFLDLILLLIGEVIVGFFIGSMARILMSAVHSAGMIISYQTGMSAATLFDPTQGAQGAVIGNFLTMIAVLLIFSANIHHMFIYGIIDSYKLFLPGRAIDFGSMSDVVTEFVASSFVVAIQMSSPHIIIGLISYLAIGIVSRLMPQMQVFFIMLPAQIILGLVILMIVLSSIMMWFQEFVIRMYGNFLG